MQQQMKNSLIPAFLIVIPLLLIPNITHTVCPLTKTTRFFAALTVSSWVVAGVWRSDVTNCEEKAKICEKTGEKLIKILDDYAECRKKDEYHAPLEKVNILISLETRLLAMFTTMRITHAKEYHCMLNSLHKTMYGVINNAFNQSPSNVSVEEFETHLTKILLEEADKLRYNASNAWRTSDIMRIAQRKIDHCAITGSISILLGLLSHFYLS